MIFQQMRFFRQMAQLWHFSQQRSSEYSFVQKRCILKAFAQWWWVQVIQEAPTVAEASAADLKARGQDHQDVIRAVELWSPESKSGSALQSQGTLEALPWTSFRDWHQPLAWICRTSVDSSLPSGPALTLEPFEIYFGTLSSATSSTTWNATSGLTTLGAVQLQVSGRNIFC